jgi:hypothetical protein
LNSNSLQFIDQLSGDEILHHFHNAESPLEAIVRLGRHNLTWLVSKLMCAPDGSGDPLILLPFQGVMLEILWNRKFPMIMAARGGGKTFLLGVYALLRAILMPGEEIVAIGKAFRQSKKIFEYIERIYNTSPIIREAVDSTFKQFNVKRKDPISHGSDKYEFHVGLSKIIALPIGDGESIRGQRATTLLVDEFASVNEDVLEIVVTPFLSVHKNPQKSAELYALLSRLEKLGARDEVLENVMATGGRGNQMVISGTASNRFNHFFKYWQHYLNIITSGGDSANIRRALSDKMGVASENISSADIEDVCDTWREYCVYRLPYTSMPRGYLDHAMVARNRITFSSARFKQEYLCEFPDETGGFIPMTLIKQATPTAPQEVPVPIELYGEPGARYVMGVDPARQQDYFAISILKLKGSHGSRFVYCRAFKQKEYSVIIQVILDLLRRFNIALIVMDPGGGGVNVRDMLCDPSHVPNRNDIIWDVDDERAHYKSYGRKILKMQTFTNQWVDEAIHGMRSDIEHNRLQFPVPSVIQSDEALMKQYARYVGKAVDTIFMKTSGGDWTSESHRIINALNNEMIGLENEDGDRIEDGIVDHINEAICEICAIEQQGVPGSTSVRYDLPRLTGTNIIDVRHRDRYTATLLASYGARILISTGVHSTSHLPGSGGTTPQKGRRSGRSAGVRKGRIGGSLTMDYGEHYRNQLEKK